MATIQELESFKLSDAVDFHKELNPKLWMGTQLDPKVKKQLMLIAEDFITTLGISDLDVKDITISGSNAAYSYTDHSDLDLHILVDMDKLQNNEIYRELFTAKKTLYNDQHDITIRDVPVEVYVQNINEPVESLGEYSVMDDKWKKIPKKQRANFNQAATKAKYESLAELVDLAIKTADIERVKKLIDMIKRYRKAGLSKGGEFSPENLAYKAVRSQGAIDELYDLRDKLHSDELSIEEAQLTEVSDNPYRYVLTAETPEKLSFRFQTDSGLTYNVMVKNTKMMQVHFVIQGNQPEERRSGVESTGDSFRVLSTVGNILMDAIEKLHPMFIVIMGKTDELSRMKLYRALARRLTKIIPEFQITDEASWKEFTFIYLRHKDFSKTTSNVNESEATALKGEWEKFNHNFFAKDEELNEAYTSKQQVIDHFVRSARARGEDVNLAARKGAGAWERGWRGPKPKEAKPYDPERYKNVRLPYIDEDEIGEDYDPNGPPPGPEFKPTMPKGTVRVDVSDVYDWYKLGQHISNLDGLGKHDFGQGPPSTILSFGDEDLEHKYITALKKTGLNTTDIDPIDPNQPKGMKRQKTDPTYNVNEAEGFGYIPTVGEELSIKETNNLWEFAKPKQYDREQLQEALEEYFKKDGKWYPHRVHGISSLVLQYNKLVESSRETWIDEVKDFWNSLRRLDHRSKLKLDIGSKISVLQLYTHAYDSDKVFEFRGNITPKKIVDMDFDSDDKVETIYFEDGTSFPDRSFIVRGQGGELDGIITMFFGSEKAAEQVLLVAELTKPIGWKISKKNLQEGVTNIKEASGYIPSNKQRNDPRFKTALTVDVGPDAIKKNAKAFGFKTSRAGIPPQARADGKIK